MAKINITQVRSRIGATQIQCKNLDALGLRKMGRTVQHEDSAIIMGMVEKVRHLVTIEMNAAPIEKKAAKNNEPKATAKAAPKKEAKAETEKVEKPVAEKKPAADKINE